MHREGINPEILEEMVSAEIAVKYGCHSQALETLNRLAQSHPNYLPAKEALETVYRETGQIELATGIAKEIELIRSQLANEAVEKTQTVDGKQQIRRRQFIAGVDSIVREIYDTRDEEEVLRVSASKIAESIGADRCVMVVREKDGLRARSHEYCKSGVAPSLDSKTAKLTFLISRLVSESPDPRVVTEPRKDRALAECWPVLEQFGIQSIAACPLLYKSDRIGMIVAHRCAEPIEWGEQEVTLLSTLGGHVAVALKNAQHFREAHALEVKDELTGLHTRSFFEQRLSVELRNAQQQNYPICLATVSVNDLQSIAGTQGQAAADIVLHKVGFLLKTHLRKGSVIARSGDAQFMVILPSASETVAHLIMSQIKSVVEQNLKTDGGRQVSLSVGVMEAKTLSSKPRNIALEDVEPAEADPKEAVTLKGDLSDIAMQDIVQILESGRKCGKLVITTAGQSGAIFFNAGRIVDAGFKDKVGEPALYDLLAVEKAKFEYRPSETLFPEVINSSNTYLLLEGLRLLDEANRNRTEAA
jgi:diguanylate cyclase (GGDEF)-like protein